MQTLSPDKENLPESSSSVWSTRGQVMLPPFHSQQEDSVADIRVQNGNLMESQKEIGMN